MLIEWFLEYESARNALNIVRRMFPDKHFYLHNDVPVYLFEVQVMISDHSAWGVYQDWDYE